MYSNLYKAGWVMVDGNARVIDVNERIEERLRKEMAQRMADEGAADGEGGFTAGLDSEVVDALLAKDGRESVIKSISRQEQEELEQELENARNELEQTRAQTEQMLRDAGEQIEKMRMEALEEAKSQGYQDGYQEGMAQVQDLKNEYLAKKEELERDYEHKVEELEPKFVESLTGIYEHIFKVDLSAYGRIVTDLLIDTMQRMDNARNYIIHVSKKDFPKVNGDRKRIQEETGTLADNLEIISDATLSVSQCIIETDGGVYDCSLGTELEELERKLRLLSYRSK